MKWDEHRLAYGHYAETCGEVDYPGACCICAEHVCPATQHYYEEYLAEEHKRRVEAGLEKLNDPRRLGKTMKGLAEDG